NDADFPRKNVAELARVPCSMHTQSPTLRTRRRDIPVALRDTVGGLTRLWNGFRHDRRSEGCGTARQECRASLGSMDTELARVPCSMHTQSPTRSEERRVGKERRSR